MTKPPDPSTVQVFVSKVPYPMSKHELISVAESEGASEEVRRAMRCLPEGTYDGPDAVTDQVARGS